MLVGDAVAPSGSWWGGRPGLGIEPFTSPEAAGAQKVAAKRAILQVNSSGVGRERAVCTMGFSLRCVRQMRMKRSLNSDRSTLHNVFSPAPPAPSPLQGGFSWLLPLHGGNYSLQRAQELVQAWPDEWPPHTEPAGEQAEGQAAAAQDEQHNEPSEGIADTAAAGLGLSPGGGAAPGRQGMEGGGAAGAGDAGSASSEL